MPSKLWDDLLTEQLPCGHTVSEHFRKELGAKIGPCGKSKVSLILDSGAFSAWSLKKEVSLQNYCNFYLQNKRYIDVVVNLDVINPGNPDKAAEAGMKNFLEMREKGISAMPVFHAREKTKWLDQMLDMTDYIGLSGTSLVSPRENKIWHEMIFDYATDSKGYPLAKFHAFGDVSKQRMINFPFYSADAATWMIMGGRAACIKLDGKSYQLLSKKIRNSSYISVDDTGPKKKSWEDEITLLGIDPDKLMKFKGTASQVAMLRSYLVAADLLRLEELTRDMVKYKKPHSLLKRKENGDGFRREGPVKMAFVISPSAMYMNFPVLAALKIKNILVSYFYVATAPKEFWEEKMIPFMFDPEGFCQEEKKLKIFWEKLNECLLKKN